MSGPARVSPRFDEYLGIRSRSEAPGTCVAELRLRPEHRNIEGWIHGGVFLTVLDTAMGHAIASLLAEGIAGAATMQFSCQFLNAPTSERIAGVGQVVRLGRSSAFVEGLLKDDRGVEVARAHGVWRVWRVPEATPARSSQEAAAGRAAVPEASSRRARRAPRRSSSRARSRG